MTAKEFREKENWNKSDFFKGEYDIDLKSIDEYAEEYHQHKLKLLSIANVVEQNKQLLCDCCKDNIVEEQGDWCNDCLENPSRVITK